QQFAASDVECDIGQRAHAGVLLRHRANRDDGFSRHGTSATYGDRPARRQPYSSARNAPRPTSTATKMAAPAFAPIMIAPSEPAKVARMTIAKAPIAPGKNCLAAPLLAWRSSLKATASTTRKPTMMPS